MPELHETRHGQKLFSDVARAADALEKIALELELMRKLVEGTDPVEVARLAKNFLEAQHIAPRYGGQR